MSRSTIVRDGSTSTSPLLLEDGTDVASSIVPASSSRGSPDSATAAFGPSRPGPAGRQQWRAAAASNRRHGLQRPGHADRHPGAAQVVRRPSGRLPPKVGTFARRFGPGGAARRVRGASGVASAISIARSARCPGSLQSTQSPSGTRSRTPAGRGRLRLPGSDGRGPGVAAVEHAAQLVVVPDEGVRLIDQDVGLNFSMAGTRRRALRSTRTSGGAPAPRARSTASSCRNACQATLWPGTATRTTPEGERYRSTTPAPRWHGQEAQVLGEGVGDVLEQAAPFTGSAHGSGSSSCTSRPCFGFSVLSFFVVLRAVTGFACRRSRTAPSRRASQYSCPARSRRSRRAARRSGPWRRAWLTPRRARAVRPEPSRSWRRCVEHDHDVATPPRHPIESGSGPFHRRGRRLRSWSCRCATPAPAAAEPDGQTVRRAI